MLTIIRDALIPYASDSPAQDRQERTLSFFKVDPSATIADLAGHLECAHRTAERIVSDLRRSGRLRREGSARALHVGENLNHAYPMFPTPEGLRARRDLVRLVTGEPTA